MKFTSTEIGMVGGFTLIAWINGPLRAGDLVIMFLVMLAWNLARKWWLSTYP